MFLVYTHKITPRLTYVFKHIFLRILRVPVSFTTKVEEFVAHNGPKLTYTKTALGKEFFIKNHALLFEQGINDLTVTLSEWDDVPCFFSAGELSSIPFDIFAASFYLITRYEEYQPHVADKNERFSASQSVAFQGGFLEKPVIDIWAYKLLKSLKEKYPDYNFPKREFQFVSTINVNEAFAFKNKGIIRNIAGFLNDLVHFNLKNFARRITVLLHIKSDPYNKYEHILSLSEQYNVRTLFFFLFSEYTTFDTNVSFTNRKYKLLIKSIIDYVPFGQLFSYYTMKSSNKLNKEKNHFESVVNRPVTKSRQHLNRIEMPKTYQNLIDIGVTEEYSMGYDTDCGFRASTCAPFYFYDLDYEIQTPLLIFSFAVMDKAFINEKLTAREAFLKIKTLQHEVQKVNGTFIISFQNETFSDLQSNMNWVNLYEEVLKVKTIYPTPH